MHIRALGRRALWLAAAFYGGGFQARAFEIRSPDGMAAIRVDAGQELKWSVSWSGRTIVQPSALGLELSDGRFPNGEVRMTKEQAREIDESWPWNLGARSTVRNHCREATLTLHEARPGGRAFGLVLRAYNDGVALRYVFPASFSAYPLRVKAERTEFVFDRDYQAWIGDHKTNYGHQECSYLPGPLSGLKAESFGTAPIVVELADDCYAALAEAALEKWAGMYFCGGNDSPGAGSRGASGSNGPVTLVSKLSTRPQGDPLPTVEVDLPARSPWRVVMLGRTPGQLVESDLLLNLNDPSRISDVSWIKPGMCAWDHWWSGEQRMDTATIKQYIDFAAAMGWPYQLVDWWWYGNPDVEDASVFNVNPDLDFPEVRRYAKEQGVKLWVWVRWNHAAHDDAYRKLFPMLHDWGIVGVKVDFMQRDDQWMVQWYEDVVKCAADNQLMVDFHGAYKPTGECRTWPNLVTREGVKGNEFNKWSHEVTPTHRATLPFTRMLMGPMDFTPGGFLNRQPGEHQTSSTAAEVQGTRAQELALFVVYLSPFMCVCDHPSHILNQPGADFLKIVPTVWDDTRVLAGQIGKYVVIARRSGHRWFVAGITNEEARTLDVDLSLLGEGRWQARLWSDGKNAGVDATDLETREFELAAERMLSLQLAPAGGFAAVIEPKD